MFGSQLEGKGKKQMKIIAHFRISHTNIRTPYKFTSKYIIYIWNNFFYKTSFFSVQITNKVFLNFEITNSMECFYF